MVFQDKLTLFPVVPNHVETILNYIHFEKRQDSSSFDYLINTYIQSNQLDESAKAFFTIQRIRHLQQVNLNLHMQPLLYLTCLYSKMFQ